MSRGDRLVPRRLARNTYRYWGANKHPEVSLHMQRPGLDTGSLLSLSSWPDVLALWSHTLATGSKGGLYGASTVAVTV